MNDFSTTLKSWNSVKMREMSHDIVKDLIKRNEKRVKRIIDKLQDTKAETIIKGILREFDDLKEWLPTFEVLCNPGLQDRHWLEI